MSARGHGSGHGRGHGGFTLLELLGVVVVLSLIAGAATVRLGAASDAARRRAAVSACRQLDALARVEARRRGPLVMTADRAGAALRVHVEGDPEPVREIAMPRGIVVELETGAAADAVTFDRHGRSPEYRLRLSGPERGGQTVLEVLGLTGLVREVGP